MSLQLEEIQPGWTVVGADGQEIGTVTDVEPDGIHVKKGGLLGGQTVVPRDSVVEIETGRIELNRTKSDLG